MWPGIGKAIAIELGLRDAKVMLNDLDRKKLFYVRDELRSMGISVDAITADVRDPRQCANLIRRTINRYGGLDILVNNAGVSSRGSVEAMADSVFSTVIDTNYTGAAYLSKYAIPSLKKSKGHLVLY
ncbi:MAG: SDR family NAD(P)-dependent oxidoreductase [Saprospiraceae bacterium]|nr:SDR family NAD(P)-dependent oxidoreductase [Saprospiraceae bacterium]